MLKLFDRPIPYFLEEYLGKPDEIVKDWPGLENPMLMMILYGAYALILSCGERLMKSSSPFELRKILFCYNLLQIILNAYIVGEVMICVLTRNYSPLCNQSPKIGATTTRLARAIWLFYLTKMIDLMDTVFFILRKKDEQITFLHVYHHVAMVMAWYLGALYTPGGQAWLSVAINSGIHVLMYLYYLVSALGPSYKKYLWWKRYLTQIQLVQFFIVGFQLVYLLYNGCARPMWLAYFALCYNLTLISLFLGFYRKAYGIKSSEKGIFENIKTTLEEQSNRWIVGKNEDKKRS